MGEKPLPDVPVWKNLKTDYGAKGDGVTDDTSKLQKAIDNFPGTSPGAIYLPEGTYRISERIVIKKPYLVIRGAGRDKTKIAFTRGIWAVYKEHCTPKLGYAWPAMLHFEGKTTLGRWSLNRGSAPIIGKVIKPAPRGDTQITLDNASQIVPGKFYMMHVYNDKDGHNSDPKQDDKNFARYLLGEQNPPTNRKPWLDAGLVQWYFKVSSKSGNTIDLYQPLPWDLRPTQWLTEIRYWTPNLTENGVEDLSIDFPPESEPWKHSHKKTITTKCDDGITYMDWGDGYHAIQLDTWNSWIRNVKVTDVDNGILVGGFYNTVTDVEIGNHDRRSRGHLGIHPGIAAHELLIHNINFSNTGYVHDVTVSNHHHVVYSNIVHSEDLRLDAHGGYGTANLFTNISTADGKSLMGSGPWRGVAQAMLTTYWNIRVTNGNWLEGGTFNTEQWGANLIGVNGRQWSTDTSDPFFVRAQPWIEKWPGELINPPNIYQAQLKKRLRGRLPAVPK